ncbi:polysaccharide deacetylase family protein [Terrimonas pollutisoli]|uniref:polysaccharide deacetylase family protein n=1 Tax=Terrimonas pollutisoli TaxID=3034147 RepID=UPI0023EE0E0A|nr:polysaccharide deacetylase family protein [Terrimonas sp. H1YJ31]
MGKEITGRPFEITTDKKFYLESETEKLNYTSEKVLANEFWINPHSLLFENKISGQSIECFETNGQKGFFKTEGDYPFDIFAASFYLLSRYEEYLPHQKDIYGRYAHENSLAFKEGFLDKPLVNLWIKSFKEKLKKKFPSLILQHSTFTFLPTYDIDIAWSYKYKGWRRSLGGLLQSLIKGNWKQAKERIAVLRGKVKDPFDSYGWLHRLHEENRVKPDYFFLLAEKNGRYDKNILPQQKALQALIGDHIIRYPVGIHPSWRSGDEHELLEKEMNILSNVTGNKILSSRQHYIRFSLPETFRRLIDSGIQFDFSMGYGSINGFRASVATAFYWYDLEKEQTTNLMLFPFCFMEANSFYEQKYSAQQALDEMRYYYNEVRSVNGTFIMIWHNHFLGADKLFTGWKEVYEQFIKETGK